MRRAGSREPASARRLREDCVVLSASSDSDSRRNGRNAEESRRASVAGLPTPLPRRQRHPTLIITPLSGIAEKNNKNRKYREKNKKSNKINENIYIGISSWNFAIAPDGSAGPLTIEYSRPGVRPFDVYVKFCVRGALGTMPVEFSNNAACTLALAMQTAIISPMSRLHFVNWFSRRVPSSRDITPIISRALVGGG